VYITSIEQDQLLPYLYNPLARALSERTINAKTIQLTKSENCGRRWDVKKKKKIKKEEERRTRKEKKEGKKWEKEERRNCGKKIGGIYDG